MIERTLQGPLRQLAKVYPIVTVTGPRQSGKTTLCRAAFPRADYASLEEADVREYAANDPRGFLDQFPSMVVLDEVQRAPDLFSYIQTRVDQEDVAGRFILSGSQNFLLLSSISQSLAGRAAILHLLPFSRAELLGRPSISIDTIGHRVSRVQDAVDGDLFGTLHRGFYPRIHDKDLDPGRWLRDYVQTYVERDVREIVNVGDLEAFGRFVRLCAGRNGQLLNLSSLANDCGITHSTARRWLSILEASFLVHLLRPHHRNFGKRLIKSPKLYFLDTGLLCYLLRIRDPEDLRHHSSRGAVFESFVVAELLKNFLHRAEEPDLWFWRTSTGIEVDVLIGDGEELTALEVKSGQTVASDFFSGLRAWRELGGDPKAPAALVYGGDRSFRREGVTVYRWSDL
ncbi:MAG: ATP-binding protein [Planctomycetota bacterium]